MISLSLDTTSNVTNPAPYDEVLQIHRDVELQGKDTSLGHTGCFMISGSQILEGISKYVIVAVGMKSFNGRIMMVPVRSPHLTAR